MLNPHEGRRDARCGELFNECTQRDDVECETAKGNGSECAVEARRPMASVACVGSESDSSTRLALAISISMTSSISIKHPFVRFAVGLSTS